MSEVWDSEAATFDDEPDHGLRDPATRAAWLELLTAHLPAPPARIADLGCGTGTLSVLLADAGYAVDGVDFSPEMVTRARDKAAGRDGVTFTVADAGAPPLEAAAYDAVLCRHVLWVSPTSPGDRALDQPSRSARPAGAGRGFLAHGHRARRRADRGAAHRSRAGAHDVPPRRPRPLGRPDQG